MANLDKNQPKGYGNDVKMAGNPAPDMKSNGTAKKNIPDAMTNKVGKDAKFEGGKYEPILNRARKMKGVNLIGYVPNDEVCKALQQAHIFAYPCVFEETACLSMIEAGAAGCKLVTTNIGGLPETGSEWATLVPIQASREELVMSYASVLNDTIDKCKTFKGDEKQSEFYNTNYSWDKRGPEWERLFNALATS
jgi:glycosyltransferase involved in cell wall biosynthesis